MNNETTTDSSNAPARLHIEHDSEMVRIPIIDRGLAISERKDGPADVNRMADVHVPVDWIDRSYLGVVQESRHNLAKITVQQPQSENYQTVLHGYVSSVGGSSETNVARVRIVDPSKFLGQISASTTFGGIEQRNDIESVLEYVTGRMEEETPFEDIGYVTNVNDPSIVEKDDNPGRLGLRTQQRRFQRNRDVLTDVMSWLAKTVGGVWQIRPFGDRIGIEVTTDPHNDRVLGAHDGEESDSLLMENNALAELRPINAVRAVGTVNKSIEQSLFDAELPFGGDEFPVATVEHPTLVDRANGRRQMKRIEVDVGTKSGVVNAAKRKLKDLTDGPSGGQLIAAPIPQITPYDRVSAVPACNEHREADVKPIDYEAERVRHIFRPSSQKPHRTEIEASLYTPLTEMEVTESKMVPVKQRSQALHEEG